MANKTTFTPKLDQISENILYLLSLDARITVTDLSVLLHEKRRIIENRVNKLYEQHYIKPLLICNAQNCLKATILLKLSSFDQTVLKALIELKKFVKVKETQGEYDLSLLFMEDQQKELNVILHKITALFHNIILKMDVVYHEAEDTLGYKSFCHNPDLFKKYIPIFTNKKPQLSEEEKRVVLIIKENPLISYRELMKETFLGYNKLYALITGLKEKGILRFSVDPHYGNLGLEFHNMLVRINHAKREEFERNMILHPRIHWIKKGSGVWDYILSVTARDINEFIDITREIRTENKNCILDASTLISKIHVERQY